MSVTKATEANKITEANPRQRSKNTPEECAVIAKAWAEGKKLQHRYRGEWIDRTIQDAELDLGTTLYRVKPEPRTFELYISPDGGSAYQAPPYTDMCNYEKAGWTKIKAKEIV